MNEVDDRDMVSVRRADLWCGVCAGKGDPGTGKPCICGGSGRIDDEVVGLRKEVVRLSQALQKIEHVLRYTDKGMITVRSTSSPLSHKPLLSGSLCPL